MSRTRDKLFEECKRKLLKTRQDVLSGLRSLQSSLSVEITGDEGDMASALEGQNTSLVQRERMLRELTEIDAALQRIDTGTYGVCEETEEPIEDDRLLAIPWTRLSLDGAETRERLQKRFA
ncbi:MAG TPA: TraR/DksA family transcriptional regulator [Bdellovibrionota bacterium]|jgi:DnaK suppressor protein|nr:TraR/DksA family transcriptional regulator [Bdellovibrionota bacterium]